MIQAAVQRVFESEDDLLRHIQARDRNRLNMQPKTQEYWQGNDNTWNKKHFACPKVYDMFHKGADRFKDQIAERQNQQDEWERYEKYRARSEGLAKNRIQIRNTFRTRIVERIALQNESRQPVLQTHNAEQLLDAVRSDSTDKNRQRALSHSSARRLLKQEPANIWNDFSTKSKKLMNLYLRPEMLKNEEESFKTLNKKITEDFKRKELEELFLKIEHDVMRHDMTRLRNKQILKAANNQNMTGSSFKEGDAESSLNPQGLGDTGAPLDQGIEERIADAYHFFYKQRVVVDDADQTV